MADPEPERCCFDDWVDDWVVQARKNGVARALTRPLLQALDDAGLDGRTVLDLGCGIGDLAIGTVDRGASAATGIDLSAKAIAAARSLASERGVADRTSFDVGDAAEVELPNADVVALHRVFCCYPNVGGLLDRSLEAAGSVYAFTVPVSTGIVGGFERTRAAISNVWYRLRSRTFGGFQVYIHDVRAIDERVRAAGFHRVRRERHRVVWELAVYAR
ncbi:MAG TPA: methyltransferase domain-containing protein [Actinomycetota bacterium]